MTVDGPEGEEGSRPEGLDLRLLTLIGSLLVAATVSLTFGQVVLRYFFNNPQSWAEEVGRYLFVWITFLGAATAFARGTHIRIDAVVNLFGKRVSGAADVLRRIAEAVAAGFLLYSGVLVAWKHRNATFYTMPDVPQAVFYLAAPVGSLLALFFILRGLAAIARRG